VTALAREDRKTRLSTGIAVDVGESAVKDAAVSAYRTIEAGKQMHAQQGRLYVT